MRTPSGRSMVTRSKPPGTRSTSTSSTSMPTTASWVRANRSAAIKSKKNGLQSQPTVIAQPVVPKRKAWEGRPGPPSKCAAKLLPCRTQVANGSLNNIAVKRYILADNGEIFLLSPQLTEPTQVRLVGGGATGLPIVPAPAGRAATGLLALLGRTL